MVLLVCGSRESGSYGTEISRWVFGTGLSVLQDPKRDNTTRTKKHSLRTFPLYWMQHYRVVKTVAQTARPRLPGGPPALQTFVCGGSDFAKRLCENVADRIWFLRYPNILYINRERQMFAVPGGRVTGQTLASNHYVMID